jgi:beta-glucosidase
MATERSLHKPQLLLFIVLLLLFFLIATIAPFGTLLVKKRSSGADAEHFPNDFTFGLATSAFQCEGGDGKTDWDAWPTYANARPIHPGLTAEDISLAGSIGIHELRFSIEWARVEPREGEFNTAVLLEYVKLAESLERQHIRPFINLHHFTLPGWLAAKGGLTHEQFPKYFERYTTRVAKAMRHVSIERWMTFNEPLVPIEMGYLNGYWPPEHKGDTMGAARASWNIIRAHKLAYRVLHRQFDTLVDKPQVGMAYFDHLYLPANPNNIDDQRVAAFLDNNGHAIMDALEDYMDYIGINYYNRCLVAFSANAHPSSEHLIAASNPTPTGEMTEERMEIFPEGIRLLVERYVKYRKPILITENGIGDRSDTKRARFIAAHLREVHMLVRKYEHSTSPIIGYFYWTLADNFEWTNMRMSSFGLIAVDAATLRRSLRPSALFYRDVIAARGLTREVLRKHQEKLK